MRLICLLLLFLGCLDHGAFGQGPFVFKPVSDIPVRDQQGVLPLAWAGGLNSGQYHAIDLNDDGLDDLAVFDRTTDKINTFLRVADSYVYSPQYEYLFPADLNSWIFLADYNCDGRQDIFSNTTFGLKVYKNTFDQQLSFELQADPLLTESGGLMVNLQVSSSDMPAISDVDGDGDLDLLIFNFATGGSVEYHQNQSMERYGNCNELEFQKVSSNYGNFQECDCGVYAFGETCAELEGRQTHAGGKSLLSFDQDHDGDQELIFGDEFCTNITFLRNQGSAANALFEEPLLDFPSAANPIDFFIFPAVYLVDVNFDGARDLVAAPNMFENLGRLINFRKSSRLYLNQGLSSREEFVFSQDDWLQNEMLEFGEKAVPLFIDFDGDSDLDMLVGNRGNQLDGEFYATFSLFENQGFGASEPDFQLIDDDYLGLSELRFQDLKPSYADLNGDGRPDLIFSAAASNGQTSIYYFLNQETSGFISQNNSPDLLSVIIQAGDHPSFTDLDNDGWADMLLGKRTGRLEYWRNQATSAPTFELVSQAVAGIVDDSFKRELAPLSADLNGDGSPELITLDATGVMRVYTNFLSSEEGLPVQEFDRVLQPNEQALTRQSRFGRGGALAVAPVSSGLPYLVFGNHQGGLFLLKNFSDQGSSDPDRQFALQVFPNPGKDIVRLEANEAFKWQLFNSLGQLIRSGPATPTGNSYQLYTRSLSDGVYFLKATGISGIQQTSRLLILH